jgi:hypothetical protein
MLGSWTGRRVISAVITAAGALAGSDRQDGCNKARAKTTVRSGLAKPSAIWGMSAKTFLPSRGLVTKAPQRGAHRRKRPRRPMVGMMLHQDSSRHAWLAGVAPLDLVATLDDATSEL